MKRSIVQTLSTVFASVFTGITIVAIGPSIALLSPTKSQRWTCGQCVAESPFNRRIRAWDKVGKPRPFNDALRVRRKFASS
jgi:hypothetical protein